MPTLRRPSASTSSSPTTPGPAARNQRGIQSIEVGGQLLRALAHHGQPMALKDLARDAGMSAAKAHPYLVSFGKLGLIGQDSASGRYGLGPLAMQLGLISLQQFDPVRLATPVIGELARTLKLTVAIAVWGNRGATMVRIEEAPTPVHVNMRHGTVMSLRGTASGLLFAAHLPTEMVLEALSHEPGETGRARKLDPKLVTQLAEIHRRRLSRAIDASVPGVSAMAAPVYDESGTMVLSLTAIGPTAVFDTRLDGSVAMALTSAAQDLSRRLGARDASTA
jgi:DNA-binding IclR family transcriptional regulator